MSTFFTLRFVGQPFENLHIEMLDQLKLPEKEEIFVARSSEDVARAIETMVIRGAPAIGVCAAMGLALGFERFTMGHGKNIERSLAIREWGALIDRMNRTRPTAVNLFWATRRMNQHFLGALEKGAGDFTALTWSLYEEATTIFNEDVSMCRAIGKNGNQFIRDGARLLTHCNAGALATAGYGTALGVFRAASESGKKIHVYCDETRPYLQGARLTAWELVKEGIPTTLITDNMAAHMMKTQAIEAVVVGADRIARNGDTANKIGTYGLGILCHYHRIPLYIAAPSSTFDLSLKSGQDIPIEERSRKEVVELAGKSLAPQGVNVRHPGFDVTPANLIEAIITEKGVIKPVSEDTVCKMIQ